MYSSDSPSFNDRTQSDHQLTFDRVRLGLVFLCMSYIRLSELAVTDMATLQVHWIGEPARCIPLNDKSNPGG